MAKFSKLVPLEGSDKAAPEGKVLGPIDPSTTIEVTLIVRRKNPLPDYTKGLPDGFKPLSRSQFDLKYGASQRDIDKVEDYAHQCGLSVIYGSPATRSLTLKGTAAEMTKAFGVQLKNYQTVDGVTFRGRSGLIMIPTQLTGVIDGVFGLDNRPAAMAKFKVLDAAKAAAASSFNPNDLAKVYNFPKDATGKGQCVAIIELGGGFRATEVATYFKGLGFKKTPVVKAIGVDGGKNNPADTSGANGEVLLDIEVVGAVAPDAKMAVYFAPNTDKGFLDAITQALHDKVNKPSAISISWGGAESQWTAQSLKSYNDAFQSSVALGVTVLAASGDQGSSDRETDGLAHVDFPSSSPYVVACGGTNLVAPSLKISSETVWNASVDSSTGGGISDAFGLPDYQKNTKVPPSANDGKKVGRGVPDIAADADPATGYNILYDGHRAVIGGTSAVAPLYAGLMALFNEKNKTSVGFIHPALYKAPASAFNDVTKGNNITTTTGKGYTAGAGWDACTGFGSANGVALYTALTGKK